MLDRLLRPVRRLRARTARWSVADDRRFHDSLFQSQSHDPFSESYPGYITIRRFADLASEHLGQSRRVLDLGCGPGEITCELARRHPAVSFVGVDHSAVAIAHASATARRLGLCNIAFEAADVTRFVPPERVDLVTMFDAFHHLVSPEQFVIAAANFTDSFFLIEPAGDLLGRWRRTLDFDWLPSELDKIRARLEHSMGIERGATMASAQSTQPDASGRAVENRYPAADYERFFRGFSVHMRGPVAGFDVYPADPPYASAWRSHTMRFAYDTVVRIDAELFDRGVDLHAKHWAIYATRRDPATMRWRIRASEAPRPLGQTSAGDRVRGPFEARYSDASVPRHMKTDSEIVIEITLRNDSWRDFDSAARDHPVLLSYHWLDDRRAAVIFDGLRTPLPHAIQPGSSARVAMRVRAPARPGAYFLEIELVEEGIAWFSGAGTPPLRVPVRIR